MIRLANSSKIDLSKPCIMAILNITPDSFSDGGNNLSVSSAVKTALQMVEDGADILDIGGESSRPGAEPVSEKEEINRVIPVIKAIRKETKIPISIDTYKSETAKQALASGADIVNDISALRFSQAMGEVVAQNNAPLIMMHMLGTPKEMQKNPGYENVNDEIIRFFQQRIMYAESAGISKEKIIIDPGIGFGKRLEDNLSILKNLELYKLLDCPILIGTSRKSFINAVHSTKKDAKNRIGGSIASVLVALSNGADLIRVHDVAETVEAVRIFEAIRSAK